jgi:hypothetical protein
MPAFEDNLLLFRSMGKLEALAHGGESAFISYSRLTEMDDPRSELNHELRDVVFPIDFRSPGV